MRKQIQALGRLKTGQMNKTESAYCQHLELRKRAGEIVWYRFEGIKLRLRSKMKNRKAKMLISRVYRLCYPSQWLRVSNRRVVLFSFSGIAREGVRDKGSAAQNRWKNHLRTKGD
ncbi:TPA: hypothetical protein ACYUPC_002972 [Escherichia coli]